MNKNLKKGLWYSATLLILGGIAAGIAVPIVINQNKPHELPYPDLDGSDQITGDLTFDEIKAALDEAGINDDALLNKTNEATAFYLYEKEQKGSIELQRLNFLWDQYSQLLEIRTYIEDVLHDTSVRTEEELIEEELVDGAGTTARIDNYEATFNHLKGFIDTKIGSTDDEKERKSYESQRDSYVKEWNKTKEKIAILDQEIANVDNEDWKTKIPYNSDDNFSSNYPTILLPEANIREGQASDFNDQKDNFLSGFATTQEGLDAWPEERLSKYDGATSDAAAIDSMVFNQIKSIAFKKYSYKIDSSYNIAKLKSMIFKEIVGDNITSTATKVKIDEKHQDPEDKVFFLASETRIIDEINVSSTEDFSAIEEIVNERYLLQIQNVVIDIKQNQTVSDGAWVVSKDILKKWFSTTNGATSLVVDSVGNLFTSADYSQPGTDAELYRDKQLIGRYTSTTDSTQWESGNMGLMTALDTIGGMVPEYGVAMATILDDLYGNGALTNSPIEVQNGFLSTITSDVKDAMVQLLAPKYDKLSKQINGDLPLDAGFNREMSLALESLSEDEIARTIGQAVSNKFDEITDVSGKDQTGIAQVIKIIDDGNAGTTGDNVYMVVTKDFGIHVMKVNTGAANVNTVIQEDLAQMAKNQDPTSISKVVDLLNTNYDRQYQIKTLLDPVEGDPAYRDYLNNHIKEYEAVNETIVEDVEAMINSLITNSDQKRIRGVDPQKYIDYLIGAFDSNMVSEDFAADPAELYRAIEKLARVGGV